MEEFKPKTQEQLTEEKKQAVIEVLRKEEDRIAGFNFGTNAVNGSGNWVTSEKKENKHVQYDSRYKNSFDVYSLQGLGPIDLIAEEVNGKNAYYIFDKEVNRLTFVVPLGQCFEDTRPGNHYHITLKFKKEDVLDKSEIIDKISELLKTLNYYYRNDVKSDRYKIAKQGLPVVEAFSEISKKYQDGNLSIEQTVDGYKKIIKEYEQST